MSDRAPESGGRVAMAMREARSEWRVRHMQLTDAMRDLRACKACLDEAWDRTMAIWEKTDDAVRRWREAAGSLAPPGDLPAGPARGTESSPDR